MTVSVLQNPAASITPHHGSPAMNINAHIDRAMPPPVIQKFQFTEFPTSVRPMLPPNCEQRKCCNVSFHGVNFHRFSNYRVLEESYCNHSLALETKN